MESIALVNACFVPEKKEFLGIPQGLLAISTYLYHNTDYTFNIYDMASELRVNDMTPEGFYLFFKKIPELVIGISVWDSILPKLILALEKLKHEEPYKIIILGGPTVSSIGELLINQYPFIDYVVFGEGEKAIEKILNTIFQKSKLIYELPNNVIERKTVNLNRGKENTRYLKNNEILPLDYNIVNMNNYNKYEISMTRGCVCNCSFCSASNAWGAYVKYKLLDYSIIEIQKLRPKMKNSNLFILDDNFGANYKQLLEICYLFTSIFEDINWNSYYRIDNLKDNLINKLANSNCNGIFVGIESGDNDRLIKLKKRITVEKIINRLEKASKSFTVTASFIWGYPDETHQEFLQTLILIDRLLSFDNIYINLYQLSPLSGTLIQKENINNLSFDKEFISGLTYPPYLPPLTDDETNLIISSPDIYSAFYFIKHKEFENKIKTINNYIGIN